MSLIGNLEAYNLNFQRAASHTGQGESGSIVFLKRAPGTNALAALVTVGEDWSYSSVDRNGNRLPPDVLFELRVAEDSISSSDLKQAAAIQHGSQLFQIVRPSPFELTGFERFWRFWLAPAEDV